MASPLQLMFKTSQSFLHRASCGAWPVARLTDVRRILQTGVNDTSTWAQWHNGEIPEEDLSRNITRLYKGRAGGASIGIEHHARAGFEAVSSVVGRSSQAPVSRRLEPLVFSWVAGSMMRSFV